MSLPRRPAQRRDVRRRHPGRTAHVADGDYVPGRTRRPNHRSGASDTTFDVTSSATRSSSRTRRSSSTSTTSSAPRRRRSRESARSSTTTSADDDPRHPGRRRLSPLVGASVSTRGIVTASSRTASSFRRRTRTPTPIRDSEGIFVFTGRRARRPPWSGALVQVTGTVTEFVPGADPVQPPLTESPAADDRALPPVSRCRRRSRSPASDTTRRDPRSSSSGSKACASRSPR